jgi:hypothetical protein
LEHIIVDALDACAGDSDRVWPGGAASGEDAAQGIIRVPHRVNLQHIAAGLVEVAEHDDIVARFQAE